nr:hypothetical protein Iba_chr06aCG17780 [Ipomoea batatas]
MLDATRNASFSLARVSLALERPAEEGDVNRRSLLSHLFASPLSRLHLALLSSRDPLATLPRFPLQTGYMKSPLWPSASVLNLRHDYEAQTFDPVSRARSTGWRFENSEAALTESLYPTQTTNHAGPHNRLLVSVTIDQYIAVTYLPPKAFGSLKFGYAAPIQIVRWEENPDDNYGATYLIAIFLRTIYKQGCKRTDKRKDRALRQVEAEKERKGIWRGVLVIMVEASSSLDVEERPQKKVTEFGYVLWHGDDPDGGTNPLGSMAEKALAAATLDDDDDG